MKSLSKEKVKEAKEAIKKLKKNFSISSAKSNVVVPIYDEVYYSAVDIMDEDELAEFSGCAEISYEQG
jgi:hypothetical protein